MTAGIDFGLELMARILGEDAAKRIQLMTEYRPEPPFNSGSPSSASAENLDIVMRYFEPFRADLDLITGKDTQALKNLGG